MFYMGFLAKVGSPEINSLLVPCEATSSQLQHSMKQEELQGHLKGFSAYQLLAPGPQISSSLPSCMSEPMSHYVAMTYLEHSL